jgi:uncharacterized membrane protein YoaK (UPF0700 family)
MSTFFTDIRRTIIPDLSSEDGPLPPLLVTMTLVTGLVDAFSYLVLGHVFVANMTGNVVFLGFAVAGAPGFSIGASVVALASFWFGALIGGWIGSKHGKHRGRLLSTTATIQGVLLGVAVIVAVFSGSPITAGFRYPLIAVLGLAMGLQNAAARKLAVPDLTTTVLTLTITGTAADSAFGGGKGSKAGRRLIAVTAMFLGALVGAALIVQVHIVYPLVIALIAIASVAAATGVLGRSNPTWVRVES